MMMNLLQNYQGIPLTRKIGNHSEISLDTSSSSESDSEVDEDDSVDSEPDMIDLPLRRRYPRRNRQARQFPGTIPWDAFAD